MCLCSEEVCGVIGSSKYNSVIILLFCQSPSTVPLTAHARADVWFFSYTCSIRSGKQQQVQKLLAFYHLFSSKSAVQSEGVMISFLTASICLDTSGREMRDAKCGPNFQTVLNQ